MAGDIELVGEGDAGLRHAIAHGAVGLGGVNVEDAAARGILAGHLDDVGGGVADGVEVSEQRFEVEGFAAANGAGEVGIIIGGAKADGGGRNRRDDDGGRSGRNLP